MSFIETTFGFLKDYSFLGNTAYEYYIALAIFIGLVLLLKVFQVVIIARLKKLAKKTKTDFDDALIEIFSQIKPPFYFFIALYFALKTLAVNEFVYKVLMVIILIAVVVEVVRSAQRFIDYFIEKYLTKAKDGKEQKKYSETMLKAASGLVKITLWVIAIILVLSNLGVNVTSLIASLGIGGIAIALALQNVLGDIFSSFSLYMDKPFQIGDFITVGPDSGTVEKIGLKTTRIKTLQGEELVVSNKELTTSRVQNFKKLEQRRVVVNLGVVYDSTQKNLRAIPKHCKEIIDKIKKAKFDRCHFAKYAASSLDFELVYFVDSAEYADYMDVNQRINIEIFNKFNKEGIEFAYPTQTVLVRNEDVEIKK